MSTSADINRDRTIEQLLRENETLKAERKAFELTWSATFSEQDSELLGCRESLHKAKAERDAARAWAKAWKQAAKLHRVSPSVADAMREKVNAEFVEFGETARRVEKRQKEELAAALRVVEAAREYVHGNEYIRVITTTTSNLCDAVREWEAALGTKP